MIEDACEMIGHVVTAELPHARRDPERMSALIEQLARSLGLAIAVGTNGDAAGIDKLMAGAEAHAHAEAVASAPLARLIASANGGRA